MKVLNEKLLDEYISGGDVIHEFMKECDSSDLQSLTITKWLETTPAKRMVFKELYGDIILGNQSTRRVLDIGGSVSTLTPTLLQKCNYTTIDILAHETEKQVSFCREFLGKKLWQDDWYRYDYSTGHDLIIANDIFPNVDQRLSLFLDKTLPSTKEIRLLLTVYEDRYYKVKRCDADEVLWMKAWSMENLVQVLEKYKEHIVNYDSKVLNGKSGNLYPNKRDTIIVTLKGK